MRISSEGWLTWCGDGDDMNDDNGDDEGEGDM